MEHPGKSRKRGLLHNTSLRFYKTRDKGKKTTHTHTCQEPEISAFELFNNDI